MVLAKSQIQAAEASLTSHDAHLAACQQQLDQLHDEVRAADEAADLVCNNVLTMHSSALYFLSVAGANALITSVAWRVTVAPTQSKLQMPATIKLQPMLPSLQGMAHAGVLGSDTARGFA